jgi:hypothetical protein
VIFCYEMITCIYTEPPIDKTCVLLPPHQLLSSKKPPAALVGALVTRYYLDKVKGGNALMRTALKHSIIQEWEKLHRIDTEAGDTVHAVSLVPSQEDGRDASFVRVRQGFIIFSKLPDADVDCHFSTRYMWTKRNTFAMQM